MLDLTKPIRTLGLYQPFATLMLHGKIETRLVARHWDPVNEKIIDRKPPFQLGTYLIYSTKRWYYHDECVKIMGRFYEDGMRKFKPDPSSIKRGYAIAIGNLIEIIDPIGPDKNTFVDLDCVVFDIHNYPTHRRIGLVFENVLRIEPFRFKGKQGVGFMSDEDKKKIKFIP